MGEGSTNDPTFQVTATTDELLSVSVEDQVHVANPQILNSPHVSEGPGRIANSPVPSVFMDDRGEIHRVRTGHKRVNLLYSKMDVMRSGYLLATNSFFYVVSGKVEVWRLHEEGTRKQIYEANQPFSIPAFVPYILHFLEDSVTVEYWKGEFRCFYYHPYRRVVDLQNSLVAKANHIPHLQRLLPQDDKDNLQDASSKAWLGLGAGLAVGLVLGSVVTIALTVMAGDNGGSRGAKGK